ALAQWSEYTRNDSTAVKFYKFCMDEKADESAECGARLADLYTKLENTDRATAIYQKIASLGDVSKPGKKKKKSSSSSSSSSFGNSPYVGYCRYKLAEMMERGKHFDSLQLPDDRLKRGLEQRLAFLESLTRSYQAVVEASGPWSIAALDRLA